MNTTNIIHELRETELTGENLKYHEINTIYNCPEPPVIPISFVTPGSYARLKGYEGMPSLNVSLGFRSYENRGIILYHRFTSPGYVKVSILNINEYLLIHKEDTLVNKFQHLFSAIFRTRQIEN